MNPINFNLSPAEERQRRNRAEAYSWKTRQSPLEGLLHILSVRRRMAFQQIHTDIENGNIALESAREAYKALCKELKTKPVLPGRKPLDLA
jgi:glutathione S-transferase